MTSIQFFFAGRIDRKASQILLEGEEHHHLARVVRIKAGDVVRLFNDQGNRFLARIESVENNRTRLRIIRTLERDEAEIDFVFGQALIKPKNMDLIVQKSTELGVTDFVPLQTARSLRIRAEAGEKKLERWRRIAREAAKQCRRAGVPSFGLLRSLEDFVKTAASGRKLFLNESGGTYLRDILAENRDGREWGGSKGLVLLVGPEGGWTNEEKGMLADREFVPVSLGKTVLRAETAAILAVGMISHFWNS